MSRLHDVIIIGAGPSGLNTARLLAAGGLDVVVLEKKKSVGSNIVCTGIVGNDTFSRFKLPQDSIVNRIQAVDLFSPLNMKLTYRHSQPFAYVVDRKKFDTALLKKAREKGAAVKTGCEVKDITVFSDRTEVSVRLAEEERNLHGRMLVLATGNNFRLHKSLNLGRPREFLNAVQVELDTEKTGRTEVWVGKNVAPGGFAWSVPIRRGRVRTGLFTKESSLPYLDKFLEQRFPDELRDKENLLKRNKIIAQGVISPTFSSRAISVGEAAGQVKTTTGGGIFYGLFCSEIAANVIIERAGKDQFEESDLAEYEKSWKKSIQKELTVGYYTRKICSRLKDREVEKLFQIARDDGVFPLIRETAHFDWQKDIILALARKATVQSLRALPAWFR